MPDPFDWPLRIGDADQIAAMRAMNGEWLYCPKCYAVFPGGFDGQHCDKCGHDRVAWGAASPKARTADAAIA